MAKSKQQPRSRVDFDTEPLGQAEERYRGGKKNSAGELEPRGRWQSVGRGTREGLGGLGAAPNRWRRRLPARIGAAQSGFCVLQKGRSHCWHLWGQGKQPPSWRFLPTPNVPGERRRLRGTGSTSSRGRGCFPPPPASGVTGKNWPWAKSSPASNGANSTPATCRAGTGGGCWGDPNPFQLCHRGLVALPLASFPPRQLWKTGDFY